MDTMDTLVFDKVPGKGHPGALSLVVVAGMMEDGFECPWIKFMKELGGALGLEVISFKDAANMGLGPPSALRNLSYTDLVENAKRGVAFATNKAVVVSHSLGFGPAMEAALDENLKTKVVGNLCLAPAPNDIVMKEYCDAMRFLQEKSDQGDQQSSVTLAQMKAGELVYVDTMDIGLPFPYMEKFVTSVFPHRFSFDRELPISQPTTIIHGTRDTTVKLESSVALHAKLPNSALIERDMGHHFNSSKAFETVREEVMRLIDTATPNWAGRVFNERNKAEDFTDMPEDEWVIHQLASDTNYTKFRIRNRVTNKVYANKYLALRDSTA